MVMHLDPTIKAADLIAAMEFIDCRVRALPNGELAAVRRDSLKAHYDGVLRDARKDKL